MMFSGCPSQRTYSSTYRTSASVKSKRRYVFTDLHFRFQAW